MKRIVRFLGVVLFAIAVSASAQNTAPSITAAGTVFLTMGDPGSSATIATVNDAEDGAGSLNVSVFSAPAGISVSSITNTNGSINATITVGCDASAGDNSVVLEVADSEGAVASATFVVNVRTILPPSIPTISATENGTGTTDQACPAQPLTLHASAANATSYQWYDDGFVIDGATSDTYVATGHANLTVTASNACFTSAQSFFTYSVSNPTPHRAFVTTSGSTSFCAGGSVTLMSDSATGIQWYRDGVAIAGAGHQNYVATQSGSYTATLNALGCQTSASDPITVTVSSYPPKPAISGPDVTYFCAGDSITLTSSSATGNQWYINGELLGGSTGQTYVAEVAGDYTVVVSNNGCASAASDAFHVDGNVTPHRPFITAAGSTSLCTGGSVTLMSDAATGIQWYRDGVAISGAGSQNYIATQSGQYTATLNALGCIGPVSDPITVTVNAYPATPTITGTSDQACPEQPLTLTATSSGATSFQWYSDDASISGETSSTLVVTARGNYSATATSGGCTTPRSSQYVVQNPTPHKAFLSTNGPTTFCTGGSVTIFSDSATGIQWYRDGVPIATSTSYAATQSGSYTVILNALGCHAQESDPIVVTVNPYPDTPTISGPDTTYFCAGGSVTLTSSSATGNQWYINGEMLGGSTNQTYVAAVGGEYTVIVTNDGCSSGASNAFHVEGNVTPHTPVITTSGATTFCSGGSVTLTSNAATGIQWYRDGVAISGAGSQSYVATQSGSYTATLNALGCISPISDAVVVTVNANPSAAITAPANAVSASTGNSASVASAGSGATYTWSITNGTITSGSGTNAITFTAGATGSLTLQVTVTTGAGCSATASASVNVVDPVTVTNVTPSTGSSSGGTSITIKGTGFASGASVTLGGTAATSVVVVSATKITATTPAHSSGAVNVVVTNSNSASGTLTNGFTYKKK